MLKSAEIKSLIELIIHRLNNLFSWFNFRVPTKKNSTILSTEGAIDRIISLILYVIDDSTYSFCVETQSAVNVIKGLRNIYQGIHQTVT